MDGSGGALPALPQSVLPRVPSPPPSAGVLPWSRVGEIVIFTFVALIALYLLWLWVLRDLIFLVKARRGISTEEVSFGTSDLVVSQAPTPVGVSASCPPGPVPFTA
ncbi:putative movement protein [Sugarcane streak Egypt virus - [Aswan]]|nr:putative movement protein [Sugarcane streak Egypt virus - [Aswan]]